MQGFCLPWHPRDQISQNDLNVYGSSGIKKAPYRTKPLWCAHNRRRPHGHNARCRDQPGVEPARRTSGSQKAASRSPPERGPYRLFQADTRSSASCCSRLSPQYSPTITWSHSALPLHATTVRSGFNRLRVGEKDCRPRRHASPALPAMAVPAAARPPHRASAPAGGASGRAALQDERAGACACLLLRLSDLRGLFSVPRPCTPSFQLALLSFLWEESVERECRHFCNSLLSRVRGETSLATAKTSKIEATSLPHSASSEKAGSCDLVACFVTVQNYYLSALWAVPARVRLGSASPAVSVKLLITSLGAGLSTMTTGYGCCFVLAGVCAQWFWAVRKSVCAKQWDI